MSIFKTCDKCDNILLSQETKNSIYFTCSKCLSEYKSSPEDTELFYFSFEKKESHAKYDKFIKNMIHGSVNPTIVKQCPECPLNPTMMVNYIITGHSMKFIYGCKDGHIFT